MQLDGVDITQKNLGGEAPNPVGRQKLHAQIHTSIHDQLLTSIFILKILYPTMIPVRWGLASMWDNVQCCTNIEHIAS